MKILIAFAVGMLLQHTITGDHARYGFEVMSIIDRCERNEGRECDIIASPIHKVSVNDADFMG